MSEAVSGIDHQAVQLVKAAVARAVEVDGFVALGSEGQVHRAVDMLRSARADQMLLGTVERISCAMTEMSHLRRQGRVNAYASRLLRLKKAGEAL